MKKQISTDNISLRSLTPPLILEQILRTTVGVVNAAFLSYISRSAVTAVNVSNQYIMLCQIIATAVATGMIVCLNQSIGMNNKRNINKYSTVAFLANALLGLLFGLVFFFLSESFLSIMTFETAEIRNMAVTYMRVVGSSLVIQCVQIVLNNINRSVGLTKAPLVSNCIINGTNILGCYLVIKGHLFGGFDPIFGVAVCNVFAQFCGLIFALLVMRTTTVRISLEAITPFPWRDVKLALSIVIPAGINNISYSLSQIITSSIISQTSQLMFDAKSYITSVIDYVALIGMAFAQAATILIGNKIGAGDFDDAHKICNRVTRIAVFSNIGCSVGLLFTYKWILGWVYSSSEGIDSIIEIAGIIILIDIVVEIGRALNNSLAGALQAVGDMNFQLIVNQSSGWVIAVGGAYLFGIVMGWELYGIWMAFALDEYFRGSMLLYRWHSRKWEAKARMRTKTIAG